MLCDVAAQIAGANRHVNCLVTQRRVRVVAEVILNGCDMHDECCALDVWDRVGALNLAAIRGPAAKILNACLDLFLRQDLSQRSHPFFYRLQHLCQVLTDRFSIPRGHRYLHGGQLALCPR